MTSKKMYILSIMTLVIIFFFLTYIYNLVKMEEMKSYAYLSDRKTDKYFDYKVGKIKYLNTETDVMVDSLLRYKKKLQDDTLKFYDKKVNNEIKNFLSNSILFEDFDFMDIKSNQSLIKKSFGYLIRKFDTINYQTRDIKLLLRDIKYVGEDSVFMSFWTIGDLELRNSDQLFKVFDNEGKIISNKPKFYYDKNLSGMYAEITNPVTQEKKHYKYKYD